LRGDCARAVAVTTIDLKNVIELLPANQIVGTESDDASGDSCTVQHKEDGKCPVPLQVLTDMVQKSTPDAQGNSILYPNFQSFLAWYKFSMDQPSDVWFEFDMDAMHDICNIRVEWCVNFLR
jgi:hypothetical protein